MTSKPMHLGANYAEQFTDASIVAAYGHRPPYPEAIFALLGELVAGPSRDVLELGAGSGDLTFGLAKVVARVDAVEPSDAMRAAAAAKPDAAGNVDWFAATAESFVVDRRYGLAVAAESVHWMDWEVVLPKVARLLAPDAVLAVVTARTLIDLPWEPELRALIAEHSTNRDYKTYDIVEELALRGLFREHGRRTLTAPLTQRVEHYVESFHSRNGFSRERMHPDAAARFDDAVRALVARHRTDGLVVGTVSAKVIWGSASSRSWRTKGAHDD